MTALFTKVNQLVLLFSFTMILITKNCLLRELEYLMRLANWIIPPLLLSDFQISNANFITRWWMVDLLKIALWLYFMKKERKHLCILLRTRLMFHSNNVQLGISTKREKLMGNWKNGIKVAKSMLFQQTSDSKQMEQYMNYKRMAPMITTKLLQEKKDLLLKVDSATYSDNIYSFILHIF